MYYVHLQENSNCKKYFLSSVLSLPWRQSIGETRLWGDRNQLLQDNNTTLNVFQRLKYYSLHPSPALDPAGDVLSDTTWHLAASPLPGHGAMGEYCVSKCCPKTTFSRLLEVLYITIISHYNLCQKLAKNCVSYWILTNKTHMHVHVHQFERMEIIFTHAADDGGSR